jgi:hypothetical protein
MAGQASETADRYRHVTAVLEVCSYDRTIYWSCVAYVQYQSFLWYMNSLPSRNDRSNANVALGHTLEHRLGLKKANIIDDP